MKDDVFIRILDDPPAPPPGPPGTRWGYKFWEDYERRARARELRNRKLRVLQELATLVPHNSYFVRSMDPTLPVELQTWPVDLLR